MIDNIRLPEDIERGAQGGPGWQTTVITMGSGRETRNQDWQKARSRWDIGYGIRSRALLEDVLKFHYNRRGMARGFRFKDWLDFQLTGEPVALVDGDATKRQIVRSYLDGINDYVRVIEYPVVSTISVYVNDLLVTTDFTIEALGIINFVVDPGVNVKVTAEYDVPVRFDIDTLPVTLNTYQEGVITGIRIVELRGE